MLCYEPVVQLVCFIDELGAVLTAPNGQVIPLYFPMCLDAFCVCYARAVANGDLGESMTFREEQHSEL